jgi:addiction module HigA family antidote
MFKNGMRPVHPGEILLEDYIKPMGVSVRAVAIALHVPYSRLSEITKGERGVSADTALRLERYFGSDAKGWLNLQPSPNRFSRLRWSPEPRQQVLIERLLPAIRRAKSLAVLLD